jgi:putative endonuclease
VWRLHTMHRPSPKIDRSRSIARVVSLEGNRSRRVRATRSEYGVWWEEVEPGLKANAFVQIVEGRPVLRNSEKAARNAQSATPMTLRSSAPRSDDSRAQRGADAEALAARFLIERKLRIIDRNYRCRGGEIDLIAEDGSTLVFVEVRLRRDDRFGGAAASVTRRKQQRVILAARHYLGSRSARACRFDVIALDGLDPQSLQWIRDAFSAD